MTEGRHRLRACVLLVLLFLPLPGVSQALADTGFDSALTANVVATGLAFIAPRALDQVSIPQLALWGMEGFAALDPSLSAGLRNGQLVLDQGARRLAAESPPAEDDPVGWAEAVAAFGQAATGASEAIRQAGTHGVIASFYGELFNRMDPYSRYVPPPPDGGFVEPEPDGGIGAELAGRPGAVSVVRLKADGPADEAGIQLGERILAVDGQSTAGQSAATIRSWLAGPEGTEVGILLGRHRAKSHEVRLMRAIVPPETVFPERRGPVLVLRITSFARDTDTRLEAELLRSLAPDVVHPPTSLVFDLRGNRGGLLRQAVLAADAVLSGGVVAVTIGRDPEASVVWHARPDDLSNGLPIVVLVDGRTASAAEIFAAGLQDHGRAVVVGSTTLGKGLVQAVSPLPDGGEIFVSWSRVLAPSGYPLQALGVLPQICTSLGDTQIEQQMKSLAEGKLATQEVLMRHADLRTPVPMNTVLDLRATCPASEGREADLRVAQRLLATPQLYDNARLALPLPPY